MFKHSKILLYKNAQTTDINSLMRFISLIILAVSLHIFFIADAFAGNSYGGLVFLALSPNLISNGGDTFSVGSTSTGGTFCAIIAMMNSGIARGIAALCVVFIGVAALFGQVKWTQAVLLGVGIASLFGASSLVSSFPAVQANEDTKIEFKGVDAELKGDKQYNLEVKTCN